MRERTYYVFISNYENRRTSDNRWWEFFKILIILFPFRFFFVGVVNSISQACGKLSFNIANYLYTQKEGMKINLTV